MSVGTQVFRACFTVVFHEYLKMCWTRLFYLHVFKLSPLSNFISKKANLCRVLRLPDPLMVYSFLFGATYSFKI